ncbi:uncharacterized protein LOC111708738 [Eurytemora carolleeae]|uniref:uncharacterized protein LOC111708738 n=1 Tax=Eurytemora carolleeae TaxID=1294199 RepID=UPI000C758ECD|nr:uncharacterized protein LOC111708738 [Eurytemora carolleeae]|eukprot:XP_023337965.1 uncharacterized protein LOC111708738 [Eurytemora affinis]
MALRKSFSEDAPLTDVEKQERLLKTLACAVENLLISYAGQPPGIRAWDMLSGLSKVLDLIQTVLKDGSMYLDYRGQTECRSFVLEQAGSQMGMFGSSSIEGWLQLQLSNQCLTMKLRDLYSDRERVALHYTETSISMNPVFRQTFIFIIEALENLDLERLSTLDLTFNELEPEPSKPVKKNSVPKLKQHRRSVSCPEVKDLCEPVVEELHSPEYLTMIKDLLENKESDESTISPQKTSSPVLNYEHKVETKSVFVKGHNRAASDSDIAWGRPISPIFNGSDDLDSSQEIKGSWSQVVPATSGCYQRPKANQSLVSFLSESGGENARKGRRAQLDRENAHFILSEAMIGTLEQLHFDASMKRIDEQEESDDEIRDLKENIITNIVIV